MIWPESSLEWSDVHLLEGVLAVNHHLGLVCHVSSDCRQIGHPLSVVFVVRGLDQVLVHPVALLKLLQSVQHLGLQVAVLDLRFK